MFVEPAKVDFFLIKLDVDLLLPIFYASIDAFGFVEDLLLTFSWLAALKTSDKSLLFVIALTDARGFDYWFILCEFVEIGANLDWFGSIL